MSDTPRTEAGLEYDDTTVDDVKDFARQLERELNAANTEIEEKRKDVVWLATEKAKLENYVMLLEEAGDAMAEWLEDMRNLGADACLSHAWREAKEAKP